MLTRALTKTLLFIIRAYQLTLGAVLPKSCRFHPSCSQYALEAVKVHGPGRGVLLAVKRIMRCHPFNPGGYDPVPDPKRPLNKNKVI
ncbi:membrane protein insertion efficiency factor YidD [candidate division TA06 bacterium]|uniref:Putative membrane protein insertion efficiency factor n=1 Tax=candidate division TA06 bacterium TaxID=2250710 RepID=A0A933ML52_UNCT6|nr:membrane protein insertion efficiency factor YidD [candidate division TA06 bacterium]